MGMSVKISLSKLSVVKMSCCKTIKQLISNKTVNIIFSVNVRCRFVVFVMSWAGIIVVWLHRVNINVGMLKMMNDAMERERNKSALCLPENEIALLKTHFKEVKKNRETITLHFSSINCVFRSTKPNSIGALPRWLWC